MPSPTETGIVQAALQNLQADHADACLEFAALVQRHYEMKAPTIVGTFKQTSTNLGASDVRALVHGIGSRSSRVEQWFVFKNSGPVQFGSPIGDQTVDATWDHLPAPNSANLTTGTHAYRLKPIATPSGFSSQEFFDAVKPHVVTEPFSPVRYGRAIVTLRNDWSFRDGNNVAFDGTKLVGAKRLEEVYEGTSAGSAVDRGYFYAEQDSVVAGTSWVSTHRSILLWRSDKFDEAGNTLRTVRRVDPSVIGASPTAQEWYDWAVAALGTTTADDDRWCAVCDVVIYDGPDLYAMTGPPP